MWLKSTFEESVFVPSFIGCIAGRSISKHWGGRGMNII